MVYQSVRALGFQPVLYLYYETMPTYSISISQVALIDKVLDFSSVYYGAVANIVKIVRDNGGIVVDQERWENYADDDEIPEETVEWVTPVATFNRKESAFATLENDLEPMLEVACGDVCLVVRIGKAGKRLAYSRVPQKDAHDYDDDDDDDDE